MKTQCKWILKGNIQYKFKEALRVINLLKKKNVEKQEQKEG